MPATFDADVDECRRRAAQCTARADQMSNSEQRQESLDQAQRWLRLAGSFAAAGRINAVRWAALVDRAGTITPREMDSAPRDGAAVLLWCADQGGWQSGEWCDNAWISMVGEEPIELVPSCWLPAPPDPPARSRPKDAPTNRPRAPETSVVPIRDSKAKPRHFGD